MAHHKLNSLFHSTSNYYQYFFEEIYLRIQMAKNDQNWEIWLVRTIFSLFFI